MKKWLAVVFLILSSLPVVYALFKPGFFITHDGEFNLLRLMHFYDELLRGQFPVRWAYDLGYRFGSPIFTFFYPLTYYLASLVHALGPDFSASLKIIVGGSVIGAVIAMYFWLKEHFDTWPAFVGAMTYLLVPYRLLVMYVTGSYGVLLSLLFLPLMLLAMDKKRVTFLALATAGLLLSHNVTAMIFLPMAVVYAATRLEKRIVVGLILGIGLAATFWLPALRETKFVFLSQGVVVDFHEHFPTLKQLIYSKWGYFYSGAGEGDGMSFQVGLAQWLAWVGAMLILVKQWLSKKKIDKEGTTAGLFTVIFGAAVLMMLSVTATVWEKIPLMAEIQFPWRILVATSFCAPFLTAYLISKKFGKILTVIILGLLIWNNRNYLRTWETIRYSDAYYRSHESRYYGSTDIAWETRPIWVEEIPIWIAGDITKMNPAIQIIKEGRRVNGAIEIEAMATASANLVVNRFYYPIWKASMDGGEVRIEPGAKNGLISLSFPTGRHKIIIEQTKTGIEKLADGISMLALLGLLGMVIWSKKSSSF